MNDTAIAGPAVSSSASPKASSGARSKGFADCSWIAGLVFLTRIAFRSRYLYDIDSVNFALAIGRFDPAVHQPHPPGYFLYVMLGRLVNALTGDPNTAFVLISIAASCGAAVMIYRLSADWFGRGAAIASSLAFVLSPLAWFHGTVALTYVVECFFSAWIGYLAWQCRQERRNDVWLPVLLGIAAGFRPSSILFLGPVCAYAVVHESRARRLISVAVLGVTCVAWFVPMVLLTGGFQRYFQSLFDLWSVAGGKNTFWNAPLAFSVARLLMIASIAILTFGGTILFAFRRRGRRGPEDRERARFTMVWIGPGLIFFSFVFLRFVNAGYLLFLTPPLFAWLGRSIFDWTRTTNRTIAAAGVTTIAAVNAACFLFAPLYCSYRSVRAFEKELVSLSASVRKVASPEQTLLVGFDSHFLGYRHVAYYLPEFRVVQYPELRIAGRYGAFGARGRQTEFLTKLPIEGSNKIVLLPLPPDEEDRAYVKRVYGRFPPGALQMKQEGEWMFAAGGIENLRYLFAHL